jgi:hypothetical protein
MVTEVVNKGHLCLVNSILNLKFLLIGKLSWFLLCGVCQINTGTATMPTLSSIKSISKLDTTVSDSDQRVPTVWGRWDKGNLRRSNIINYMDKYIQTTFRRQTVCAFRCLLCEARTVHRVPHCNIHQMAAPTVAPGSHSAWWPSVASNSCRQFVCLFS